MRPREQTVALVKELTHLRGRIITSYAQVEFLLADFSVKINVDFPYRIKDRIKAAKKIVERPEYASYREEMIKICDKLLEYDEARHLMAHGMVKLTADPQGNHDIEFRLYRQTRKETFELVEVHSSVARMRAAADEITAYVGSAVDLFRRIYKEMKLE
jgi:hypothetical protein